MLHTIENEFLRISVADMGAELCSVYDKEKNREILWQADPAYWKRHAPVLFPNVGRHYQDSYQIHGRSYPSKQHGFARDSVFTCTQRTDRSVTHTLSASEQTKESYPFAFTLSITHTLCQKEVQVCWKVENTGETPMYFTIGGHPAFSVPVSGIGQKEDYYLTFDGQSQLTYLLLDPDSGTALPEKTALLKPTHGRCPITAHMFDQDALVFDHQIEKAGIAMPDGSPYITLTCKGFPNFGIWSVPGSSFVCLEPWMGRCDDFGFQGELSSKKDINTLAPAQSFQAAYQITVH